MTRPRRHVRLRLPPNATEITHPISKETIAIERAPAAVETISSTTLNLLDLKSVVWDVSADLEASMAAQFSIDASANYTYFLTEFALVQPMLLLDQARGVQAIYGSAATLLCASTDASGTARASAVTSGVCGL